MTSTKLAAYIITKNEERNIARCINSLLKITSSILVLDSDSSDKTTEIASKLGAHCVVHTFDNFSAQRNRAIVMTKEQFNPEYIITLDADEWLSKELIDDISSRLQDNTLGSYDLFLLHLQITFCRKSLKWGGFQHTWLPRLFRSELGEYETRKINEHLSITPNASLCRLKGYLINDDAVSWEAYIAKHNGYSTLEAKARIDLNSNPSEKVTLSEALHLPYLRRRWLRQHIWDKLPARPAIRFVQIYFFSFGLLDGKAGFRRALFEAWQEMCTDMKSEELLQRIKEK